MSPRVQLLLLLALALLLRLAFINQAFQLDDPYYLAAARYAQTDPWHPSHASYVFLGERVDMRGHPHPPFDGWFLGLALKLTGAESEAPLHAIYILFTLLSVGAMYALARRFTARPALATLLFMATPAFVVHGNGLESDLPLLALWLAAAAAFIYGVDRASRPLVALAGICLALASLAAYQAVLLGLVLSVYVWMRKRNWRAAAVVCALPVVVIAGYQIYERLTGGVLPVAVLMGYLQQGGYQSLANKVKNALALTGHLGWVLFPPLALAAYGRFSRRLWMVTGAAVVLGVFADRSPLFWMPFAIGVVVLLSCWRGLRDSNHDAVFLRAWILLFFAGALVIFFAGAARYLLPIVAAVAILATRVFENRPRWLASAFLLQFAVSAALAISHYQHSSAYRDFAREMAPQIAAHRTFLNGEWGFQYYGQQAGAQPLLRGSELQLGDRLLTSKLGFPVDHRLAPGTKRKVVREIQVVPRVPLRLLALSGHSAFSTIAFGVRPFGVSRAPADILTAEETVEFVPSLSYLPMSAPEAGEQIVSGIYGLEEGRWRWMSGRAVVVLKRPEQPSAIEIVLLIPEQSPARRITVALDDVPVVEKTFAAPGAYTLRSPPVAASSGKATLTITVDKTFSAPSDLRQLSIVLTAAGFKPVR